MEDGGSLNVKHVHNVSDAAFDAQTADFRSSPTLRFAEHLFIGGDTNFVNEQHVGRMPMPDDVKAGWLDIIETRQRQCVARGASFLFLLAPDKQTIYRHILPESYSFRQAAFLADSAYVLDPAPVLSAIAKVYELYPRGDSHWNHLGALIVVNAVLARLGLQTPKLDIQWVEQDRLGDLGNKLKPQETSILLNSAIRSPMRLLYDNCIPNNGRIRIWSKPAEHIKGSPRKLLLLGDSFAYDLVHFLKEAFDIVVHMHAFAMDYRVVDAVLPHIVLCEITERFLLRLPDPSDGEALTALWSDKVRRGDRLEKSQAHLTEGRSEYHWEAYAIIDEMARLFAPFGAVLKTRD